MVKTLKVQTFDAGLYNQFVLEPQSLLTTSGSDGFETSRASQYFNRH